MRSTLAQAAVILGVAGALGVYFATTRPPKLSAPAPEPAPAVRPVATPKAADPAPTPAPKEQPKAAVTPEPKPAATPEPKPGAKPEPAAPKPATPAAAAPAPKAPELSEAERRIGYRSLTLEEAKAAFDSGTIDGNAVIFVDARIFADFRDGHVRNAMHVDKRYFDGAAPAKVRQYLPGVAVIVYCNGAECTDSEAVVVRMKALNLGIGPYYIMKDGFPAWKKAGYPVDVGGEVGYQ